MSFKWRFVKEISHKHISAYISNLSITNRYISTVGREAAKKSYKNLGHMVLEKKLKLE